MAYWRERTSNPYLKWYLGRLPDFQSLVFTEHGALREAVQNIAATDSNAEWVDLDGLQTSDTVHLTLESQLAAGSRFFEKYAADFHFLESRLELLVKEDGTIATSAFNCQIEYSADLKVWQNANGGSEANLE